MSSASWMNGCIGAAAAPAVASGSAPGAATAFGVGNFEIREGTLTYRNGMTGKSTNASIERMTMHARDMSAPVAVDFRGRIDDVPVALNGDLGPPSRWLGQQWPYPLALKGDIDGNSVKLTTNIAKSGTTTMFDDLVLNYGPIAATGRVRSTTDGSKTRYAIALDIPVLSLAELPAAAPRPGGFEGSKSPAAEGLGAPKKDTSPAPAGAVAGPAPSAPAAAAGRWIVPDTPLPLGALAAIDGEGSLSVGDLKLRDGQRISTVTAQFTSQDSMADLRFGAGAVLGGSMQGSVQVDGRRADAPTVRVQLTAQQLDLPRIAAAAGITREIRGGKVRATIDVNGRGTTPHRVASTMTGTILVVSGPATLGRTTTQEQSAASQIAGALDPFRTVDASTELRCAVFRLPVANGVARIDRSIAIETGKIAGSASGTLDFRDETLDLSVQPQIRQGVKIDVSQLASVVRIRGRFDKPSVAIDAAQSAQLLAQLGALGAKGGGLEALGRALIAPADETAAPCAVALGGKAPREAASPSQRTRPTPPDLGLPKDVGKALGKLLGR
jgi:hypothetical protein